MGYKYRVILERQIELDSKWFVCSGSLCKLNVDVSTKLMASKRKRLSAGQPAAPAKQLKCQVRLFCRVQNLLIPMQLF
jgi:hypothetical protein